METAPLWTKIVLVIYIICLAYLFNYVLHAYLMSFLYLKVKKKWFIPKPTLKKFPKVCIQLPIYNEKNVAERVIRKTAEIIYPKDKLEIQVLDDSTDETPFIVKRVVEELKRQGINIKHIRRGTREGYKAGALAYGMKLSDAEFFAVFDADFIPNKMFLIETLPFLLNDEKIGWVQTRWGHLNSNASLLTSAQSVTLDGHFAMEQFVRSRNNVFMIFNGTAGIWRRKAIEDAGGWQFDTVTEDIDLSYRAQLKGWKGLYIPWVESPAEIPPTVEDFKSQQKRWAKGTIQCAKKLLPTILKNSKIPLLSKFEAFTHLCSHFNFTVLLILVILTLPLLVARVNYGEELKTYFFIASLFSVGVFAFPLMFGLALKNLGKNWKKAILNIPFITAEVIGLSIAITRSIIEGLKSKGGVFVRTPKYGLTKRKKLTLENYLEISMGIYSLITLFYAVIHTQFSMIPFIFFYTWGFLYFTFKGIDFKFILNISTQKRKGVAIT